MLPAFAPDAAYADSDEQHAIGVIGGLGPYAGLDLVRALFDETEAHIDQEHVPVTLISYPGRIPDRAAWIADQDAPSPVPGMVEVLRRLDNAGCVVAGIPCNTAHAPVLFDHLTDALAIEGRSLRLLHLIDAIVAHVAEVAPDAQRIGVLATSSSIRNQLHATGLEAVGLEAIRPDSDIQETLVQPTIYNETWGLKAQSRPTERARQHLLDAIDHLKANGAEAVILGCTELPLAIPEAIVAGLPMINSTRALARALLSAAHPAKLRPMVGMTVAR